MREYKIYRLPVSIRLFFVLLGFLVFLPVNAQRVGLVLSGGGAKGFAHIGVIRALEEHGIPIDYISGTSMGAIVGGLYAAGYTTEQMEELIYSDNFMTWSTGSIPEKYDLYYKRRFENSSMVSLQLQRIDSITIPIIPTNIVPTHSMDLGLLELFARSSAKANYNFDSLFIPFRCVASDVYSNRAVVLRSGELASAIRASMTYPFLFNPIEINGILLFDGGIHDNFPFNALKSDFEPDILIGSKVSANPMAPTRQNIRLQIENMIMTQTDYDIESVGGILIESDIDGVGILDFHLSSIIIDAGYRATIDKIEEISARVERRVSPDQMAAKRLDYIDQLPPFIFSDIYVSGTNRYQIAYITNSIRQNEEYFIFDRFKLKYYNLVGDDKISAIYPRAVFNYESGLFDLYLDLDSKPQVEIQLGGNISSTSLNQGYTGIEYRFLARNSYNFEANISFGRIYSSVLARARFEIPGAIPVFGDLSFIMNRWDYFSGSGDLFFEDSRPSFLINYDGTLNLNIGVPVGPNGLTSIGYTRGRITNRYYQSSSFLSSDTTDLTNFGVNITTLLFQRKTLNKKQYPTRGTNTLFEFQVVSGKEDFTPGSVDAVDALSGEDHLYLKFRALYTNYRRISHNFTLGIHAESIVSTQSFFENYRSTLLNSAIFQPTVHSRILLLDNYHAHSYAAVGIAPILKFSENLHLRVEGYLFQPYKKILADENLKPYYGEKFKQRHFMGSSSIVFHTPAGPASFSINYFDKEGKRFYFLFNFGYQIFNKRAL